MAMPIRSYIKDPEALLDYPIDWGSDGWLGADTITGTPVWTMPSGLTLASQSNTTTVATAWISGGVDNTDYIVECKITTASGRIDERSIRISVREK